MPLIETLTGVIVFTNAVKGFLSRPQGKIDHSLGDGLSTALRTLYFPPDGILAYLHEIERGEPVDAARTREALIAFNDRQWQISSALGGLQFDRLAKQLKLNISTVAALDRVRDEKSGLRKEIQDEINYYGRRGVRIDKQRIRRLIAAIQFLNKSIEQVDLLINSRARAH